LSAITHISCSESPTKEKTVSEQALSIAILRSVKRIARQTPLRRIKALRNLHYALTMKLHDSNEVTIDGLRFKHHPDDLFLPSSLVLDGGYEDEIIAVLTSLLNPGDVVLDVGANMGIHTMFFARAVGPDGTVIAVEPDPINLEYLKTNISLNGYESQIIVVPYAFGEENETRTFYQSQKSRGLCSLAMLDEDSTVMEIEIVRGADYLDNMALSRPIKLAKIDVVGSEAKVVAGLGAYKPAIIMFEYIPYMAERIGVDIRAFLASMFDDGYSLEVIVDRSTLVPANTPSRVLELLDVDADINNVLARRPTS
jgi:FkbM family methyltransferase